MEIDRLSSVTKIDQQGGTAEQLALVPVLVFELLYLILAIEVWSHGLIFDQQARRIAWWVSVVTRCATFRAVSTCATQREAVSVSRRGEISKKHLFCGHVPCTGSRDLDLNQVTQTLRLVAIHVCTYIVTTILTMESSTRKELSICIFEHWKYTTLSPGKLLHKLMSSVF